jgi:hypothetical protein
VILQTRVERLLDADLTTASTKLAVAFFCETFLFVANKLFVLVPEIHAEYCSTALKRIQQVQKARQLSLQVVEPKREHIRMLTRNFLNFKNFNIKVKMF